MTAPTLAAQIEKHSLFGGFTEESRLPRLGYYPSPYCLCEWRTPCFEAAIPYHGKVWRSDIVVFNCRPLHGRFEQDGKGHDMTDTLAAQIEALAEDHCPHCGSDDVENIKHPDKVHPYRVTCKSCGCGTAYHGDWKAAYASWRKRAVDLPALVTALRQAEAAPGVVEAIVRWIDQAIERCNKHGNSEGIWLFGSQWRTVRDILAFARQHGAREADEVETCCCQSFPTHCANDCPLHGEC